MLCVRLLSVAGTSSRQRPILTSLLSSSRCRTAACTASFAALAIAQHQRQGRVKCEALEAMVEVERSRIESPLVVMYPVMSLTSSSHELWWSLLITLIEHSGPTMIKAAQWASTRRDLFTFSTCSRLGRLQRRTQRRKWQLTENILKETFGDEWHVLFRRFDKEPIGSGCIAQVFKAQVDPIHFEQLPGARNLKRFHRQAYVPVAVKIAHPSIIDEIHIDLAVMAFGARLVEYFVPSSRYAKPIECVQHLREKMQPQVDLRHEGRALTRFARNFARSDRIRFPIPLHYTKEVLVETFEEGIPIDEFIPRGDAKKTADMDKADYDTLELQATLAMTGVRAVCQMVFVDNFVHGDLHPGNILVTNHERRLRPDDMFTCALYRCRRAFLRMKTWSDDLLSTSFASEFDRDELMVSVDEALNRAEPTIVLLDAGITVELSQRDMHNFRDTFKHIIRGDGMGIADLMLAEVPQPYVTDRESFRVQVADLVHRNISKDGDNPFRRVLALRHLSVANILSDLFTIVATHRVCIEPNYTCVFLALMVLEGVGRSMNPNLDLLSAARPFVWHAV